LQQHERTFDELNARLAIVTFEAASLARAYVAETSPPWPVLIDETRALYRAYGMERGRVLDVYGLRSWWAYVKEFARGRIPRSIPADSLQLGGDVLVDPDQIVRFHHVGRGPADRPSAASLLRAVSSRESGT
jgi:hypothetical protein